MRLLTWLLLLPLSTLFAQTPPAATKAQDRLGSFAQRQALASASFVNAIPFRNAGPTVMSGRVSDIDVWEEDPTHFFVGYASGGVWKTENNGLSFTPIFDQEAVMTVGDIAVHWPTQTIWVGTGEVNSSRSSYAGAGVYKSTDGGQTWSHAGLPETHHIGRILLHPDDPNTAWAAALGHLYSSNPERGVYKTTDGGKSWRKTLYASPEAGAVDLLMDPLDANTLYAATWHRERRAWDFIESGAASAIYKSTDGGETWNRLTNEGSGFPAGEGTGRIGLDAVAKDGKTILFAALDNYNRRPKEEPDADQLEKEVLRTMSAEDFAQLPLYQIEDYLRSNGFPRKYDAKSVLEQVKSGKITPEALVTYTEDANSLLFDTPVVGLEVYRSDDGGRSWSKTHDGYLDAVYNSYGYYFGQVRAAPGNPEKLFVMGVPVLKSEDGGKTWENIMQDNVHADHHALWINPKRDGHLILGNDGGINISYDDGSHWAKCNSPALGQFYAVAVDMEKPYRIYGGLQDNGVWMGPSDYEHSDGWHQSGQYPYKSIMGGDGMQVAVDTRSNDIVYTGYQFGNYFRINTQTGKRSYITPKPELGERPYRWNWQTPVHLSSHNQDILYMGANKVLRSMDQGDNFEEISGDLTKGGRKGDVPYGTLSTLHESPLKFGLLYAGSDDGLVHVSKDGGYSWANISEGLPQNLWATRVQASAHETSRVYLSLNGYRWDDFTPYLYVSEDYGTTWAPIGQGLPLEPVNVIKEDPVNPNLLYVGTDHGLYVSLDRGQNFMLLNNGIPAVAVHDVVAHPRDHDLIVGTHGRSIYIGSVKELQQLTPELMEKPLHAFSPEKIRYRSSWGSTSIWERPAPEVHFPIYCSTNGTATIAISAGEGLELSRFEVAVDKGLNYLPYDLKISEKILDEYNTFLNKDINKEEKPIKVALADDGAAYLYKGDYTVTIAISGETAEARLSVE
ncbi:WD40/YVTN/BNR-like repeat-containing protein [Phaeodactylibacter luteus]|uniref:Glycosyl hydrolase n=1 Tax=Phaeodactylibacter luteus TaxID=1564516 RepID=A0A5C6RSK9_9BACT|nr:glycosyl hydrolase [Phaeodactylibacter luteus]TXB64934.1 glycosyl hydrolase [Phaeodactylibacter luteus]